VSGFYFNRFYNDWTEDRLGGRVSVGRLLDRYWSINGAIRLENVDIRNIRTPAPPDLADVAGDNFLSTGQVTLSHDSRNSAYIPTEGTLFEASYEQAFGEFDYPKFEVTGSQYWTLYERPDGFGKHTFNLRGQVGWTGNGTPIFERFYAGVCLPRSDASRDGRSRGRRLPVPGHGGVHGPRHRERQRAGRRVLRLRHRRHDRFI
jgi:outer membrane protein insertion porin family